MFARLYEAFSNEAPANQSSKQPAFLQSQTKYYKSIKNIIPSTTSGLDFDDASKTLNPIGTDYENRVVDYPNHVFMKTTSPELTTLAARCASSTIDQLLAIRNPSALSGYDCGWMYTPPKKGSSQPVISQGAYGNKNGPANVSNMKLPVYQKWFSNLEQAKKRIQMDKCNAMTSCTDLTKSEFNTQCAWCEERKQGVPVNSNGRLLYSNDSLANCSTENLYTSAAQCPAPSATNQQGIQDQSCEPINGQLPVTCIKNQIRIAGCGDGGALSIALSSASPTNYIENLTSSDAVKIYNRHVSPPFNTEIFVQGRTTTDAILNQVRGLAGNMEQPPTSAIGAAARDLCVRQGAFKQYDICNEYSDEAAPPFLLQCVQKIFLQEGGLGSGTMYPTSANLTFYNSKGTLGAVRQYVKGIVENTKSTNYITQRDAMIQLLGITPDKLIRRVPYTQGIEVFWFAPRPGIPLKMGGYMPITGFLRRTIETNIINLEEGPSRVSQLNGNGFACMLQLTDVRTPTDFKTTFQVKVDDGFFISVNEPADTDKKVFTRVKADEPGLFQNIGLQGPTTYTSKEPCSFYSTTPNMMKIYFEDAGGGWNALKINPLDSIAKQTLIPSNFSLTCERNAPFLTFEVDRTSSEFRELRNPDLFSQFCIFQGLDIKNRADDRNITPGKRGFARVNSNNSSICFRNIAFQSWKIMSFAVRFTTMPVKATFLTILFSRNKFCQLVALRGRNGALRLQIEYRAMDDNERTNQMVYEIDINSWYYFAIFNNGTGLTFKISKFSMWGSNGYYGTEVSIDLTNGLANTFYGYNGQWEPLPGGAREACDVTFGTSVYPGSGLYRDSLFNYDIAWVHFFDKIISREEQARDANSNWIYTQFPKKLNTY
jgi:hypothetical protein